MTPSPATQPADGSSDGRLRGSYRPQDPATGFPRASTALLVIDPVNDFLSEGGAAWEMTKSTVKAHDVVGHLRQAIDAARTAGIPVIYGPMAYTEEDYSVGRMQCRCGINRLMFERKMFLAGSWGADFHPDLRPAQSEIVLLPHKGTDVFETDLPQHLERLGITHLVIAGMTANLCCESTGRRAVENGYDVTYLSDAIGAENMVAYEASIRVNYPLLGNAVMKVGEFEQALAATSALQVAAGDSVIGSDRGKIGTVDEVRTDAGSGASYMTVSTGLLGTGKLYIPLETVVQRAGSEVFINLPKLVASKMPWHEPPTLQAYREKLGPPAAQVEALYGSVQASVERPGG